MFERIVSLCAALMLLALPAGCGAAGDRGAAGNASTAPGDPASLLPNGLRPFDDIITGGQPTVEQLKEAADLGYRTVINLRTPGEGGTGARDVEALGMRYVSIPIAGARGLTPVNVDRFAKAIEEAEPPVIVHCASGNRVGAMFALKAFMHDGATPDEAMQIGLSAGLTRLEPVVRGRLNLGGLEQEGKPRPKQ